MSYVDNINLKLYVMVKPKYHPEQAMKAQRGSSVIAVFFL